MFHKFMYNQRTDNEDESLHFKYNFANQFSASAVAVDKQIFYNTMKTNASDLLASDWISKSDLIRFELQCE